MVTAREAAAQRLTIVRLKVQRTLYSETHDKQKITIGGEGQMAVHK